MSARICVLLLLLLLTSLINFTSGAAGYGEFCNPNLEDSEINDSQSASLDAEWLCDSRAFLECSDEYSCKCRNSTVWSESEQKCLIPVGSRCIPKFNSDDINNAMPECVKHSNCISIKANLNDTDVYVCCKPDFVPTPPVFGTRCNHSLWKKFSYIATKQSTANEWIRKNKIIRLEARWRESFLGDICYTKFDAWFPLFCAENNTCACPTFFHPKFKPQEFQFKFDSVHNECRAAKGYGCLKAYNQPPMCMQGLKCTEKVYGKQICDEDTADLILEYDDPSTTVSSSSQASAAIKLSTSFITQFFFFIRLLLIDKIVVFYVGITLCFVVFIKVQYS